MDHKQFGKLKYREEDEYWAGEANLPEFAKRGMRPELDAQPTKEPTPEQRERVDEAQAAALAAVDELMSMFGGVLQKQSDDSRSAKLDASRKKQDQRRSKRAARLAKGLFPIRVVDPDNEGPTGEQEEAYRRLLADPNAALDAVVKQAFAAASYYAKAAGETPPNSLADLEGKFEITCAEIHQDEEEGVAVIAFPIGQDWELEHGLYVVYHPSRPARWSTYNDLFDVIAGEEIEDVQKEEVKAQKPAKTKQPAMATQSAGLSPHEHLTNALCRGDDAEAKRLIESGVDVNDPAAYPALWRALNGWRNGPALVHIVRRMLQAGADPNAKFEGLTAPQYFRKIADERGYYKPGVSGDIFQSSPLHKPVFEEAIRLLEEAGRK